MFRWMIFPYRTQTFSNVKWLKSKKEKLNLNTFKFNVAKRRIIVLSFQI